jgi:hypothetical protein
MDFPNPPPGITFEVQFILWGYYYGVEENGFVWQQRANTNPNYQWQKSGTNVKQMAPHHIDATFFSIYMACAEAQVKKHPVDLY